MKSMFWLAVLVSVVAAVWILTRVRRAMRERERESEARAAQLLAGFAGAAPPPAPAPGAAAPPPARPAAGDDIALQKLLFESARKAGEAGEPALAIQLYGRLLARYPATAFAGEVRAAVEMLKKKLVKS